jgi:hypothetical protein
MSYLLKNLWIFEQINAKFKMQSVKVKVQQMAFMDALKSKEPISIPVLYFAFCNLHFALNCSGNKKVY